MEGKTSIIIAYALGKAQRIVQHVNHALGPIYTHGAIENTNEVFRNQGISIKSSTRIDTSVTLSDLASALVLAPPSALNSTWMRRFKKYDIAYVSGWMSVRGIQRRRNVDRGFVLSDHADWQELNQAIRATQAEKIVATHGYTEIFAKWLREQGYDAQAHTINYDDELD